MLIGETVQM